MKVTILGSGAAGGVPMVSRGWVRCDPSEPKNRRLRPSILVEEGKTTLLVDTSPDLREQLLACNTNRLTAVLYTHAHADHVHGIDDLREVNRVMQAPIDCYGSAATLADIQQRFDYVFKPIDLAQHPVYKPWLVPHVVAGPFQAGGIDVVPFEQDHGWVKSTGFRFGAVAYSTDVVNLDEDAFAALRGVHTWIVGCLMDEPHETHAHVAKVLSWAERVQPVRTVLTHMSPRLDYQTLKAQLPAGVEPGYDGMVIEV